MRERNASSLSFSDVACRLLVALATAKCCPGTGWLQRHQSSLTRSLVSASSFDEEMDLDSATATELRNAYASMDVPLHPRLEQELLLRSQTL